MPALCIGQPCYAWPQNEREWHVIGHPSKHKCRIRLVTGNADRLVPIELIVEI